MGEYVMSLNEQTLQPQQNKTKQTYAHLYGMFYTHHVLWLAQFVAVRFRPFRFVSVMTRNPVEISPCRYTNLVYALNFSISLSILLLWEMKIIWSHWKWVIFLYHCCSHITLAFYGKRVHFYKMIFVETKARFCNWQRHVCIVIPSVILFFFNQIWYIMAYVQFQCHLNAISLLLTYLPLIDWLIFYSQQTQIHITK